MKRTTLIHSIKLSGCIFFLGGDVCTESWVFIIFVEFTSKYMCVCLASVIWGLFQFCVGGDTTPGGA